MNGNPKVNPEMRATVLAAAKKLNYVPNPAARALSTNRSKTVAAIIPTIDHSVYAKYITAVEKTLSARGYTLVLAISNADAQMECDAAEKLIAMGAEAFILTGAKHSAALIDLLDRCAKPLVFTSVFDDQSAIPTIGYDNQALAKAAIAHLQEHGHRDIAVVYGSLAENDRTVTRLKGARMALGSADNTLFFEVDLSVEGGRRAAMEILNTDKRPSAILCFSDVLALGVMFLLQSQGIRIPLDISVMGFDNLDWSRQSYPSLTTIDLPASQMGAEAALQIMRRLEEDHPMSSLDLPAKIMRRGSVGPVRHRP